MREKEELKIIAVGMREKHLTLAEDLPMDELEKVFPKLMEMTLSEAAKLLKRDIRAVFQWNIKRNADGSFDTWEYITQKEWDYMHEFIETMKEEPKQKRNSRRKRRANRNVKKTAKN